MSTIKLPRKLKKGLKKAQLSKFWPGWKTNQLYIDSVSKEKRFHNRKSIASYKGVYITGHSLG